jgi:hypothetical protein
MRWFLVTSSRPWGLYSKSPIEKFPCTPSKISTPYPHGNLYPLAYVFPLSLSSILYILLINLIFVCLPTKCHLHKAGTYDRACHVVETMDIH